MRNIRLDLIYDGTHYHGWQYQPNAPTVQQAVQDAVERMLLHPATIYGASRTDSGVHANGQVASFRTERTYDNVTLQKGINGGLPDDIRVTKVTDMPDSFHPRHSSVGKRYTYRMIVGEVLPPFQRRYCYHIRGRVDIESMLKAAELFKGTHDFQSFRDAQCGARTSIRTVNISKINILHENNLEYIITGNGFLHHMVRNIAGTLIWIGKSKMSIEDIPVLFEKRQRKLAGPTAPARGLFLEEVNY